MNEAFPSIASSSSSSSSSSSLSSSSSSSSASDVLMSFLLSLPASSFSALVRSVASDLRLLRCRLALLLLSPAHFARALSRLRSLPLPLKSLLLARLLLRSLRLLLLSSSAATSLSSSHPHPHRLRLLDLDAALLLMAMCDSYHPHPHHHRPRPVDWRSAVAAHALSSALSPAALGHTPWAVLGPYLDLAAKCPRFLEVAGSSNGGGKMGVGARAAVAAVVALPSVEYSGGEEGVDGGSRECAVCREHMGAGRQVCELPCGHRFHWGCALAWLRKRNTCPCCRFELPTEDVFAEMGRLWRAVVRIGGDGDSYRITWTGQGQIVRLHGAHPLIRIRSDGDVHTSGAVVVPLTGRVGTRQVWG